MVRGKRTARERGGEMFRREDVALLIFFWRYGGLVLSLAYLRVSFLVSWMHLFTYSLRLSLILVYRRTTTLLACASVLLLSVIGLLNCYIVEIVIRRIVQIPIR